ncbi:uncharacterized protein LOC108089356 [Drosophila ficusphila]|uniref:uncharacterized protein LOC108089356 n=1 Tax=Drosophila ficusphila TaxID=30025 RepID=UPI0007E7117D|nr:uncharacterized protein LOC108089356 [Drosophila ficusphila]
MRHLMLLVVISVALVLAKPATEAPRLLIDSAPSVVSYQGSSQAQTRFVIAPMGRALGYVEPTNLNRTFHTKATQEDGTGYEQLNLSPVYVPNS